MAVRRQCNRYKTEPFGEDFDDVLRRGKAFYKDSWNKMFMMVKYGNTWTASRMPGWGNIPKDARVFLKAIEWIEVTDQIDEYGGRKPG